MRPIEGLLGYDLHWSTVEEEKGKEKCKKAKKCGLCGKNYSGGPCLIECHLDASMKPREISACTPVSDPAKQRLEAVLIELRSRRAKVDAKSAQEVSEIC